MFFDQKLFGARVQERRKAAGLTQEELAERLNVDKQHISRIERGINAASIDLLVDLSGVLNVSTGYLLSGKEVDKEDVKGRLESVIEQLEGIVQNL